jgi:hypothetical protein
MRDYTKLGVWQKAHELVLATYRAAATFPGHEGYGLQCRLGRDLGYLENQEYEIAAAAVVEVKRRLSGLLNRLKSQT